MQPMYAMAGVGINGMQKTISMCSELSESSGLGRLSRTPPKFVVTGSFTLTKNICYVYHEMVSQWNTFA